MSVDNSVVLFDMSSYRFAHPAEEVSIPQRASKGFLDRKFANQQPAEPRVWGRGFPGKKRQSHTCYSRIRKLDGTTRLIIGFGIAGLLIAAFMVL